MNFTTQSFTKNLKILYLNINSIKNKLCKFETFLSTFVSKPDIILLTEVRITPNESAYFNIPNYHSIFSTRNPNKKKKSGGGIGCFILDKYKFNLLSEVTNELDNYLLINLSEFNINIGLIYTPPDADKNILINNLESFLTVTPTLIFGDFNINLLDNINTTRNYLDCILANDYYIINKISKKFPTRISNNGNGTIIDHILCNMNELLCDVIMNNTDLSDHKLLFLNINTKKKPIPQPDKNMVVQIIDYPKLQKFFFNNPFIVNDNEDINNSTESFVKYIDYAITTNSKSIKPNINIKTYNKPWVTEEFIRLCKKKEKFFLLKKKYPDIEVVNTEHKRLSNKINSLKQKLK